MEKEKSTNKKLLTIVRIALENNDYDLMLKVAKLLEKHAVSGAKMLDWVNELDSTPQPDDKEKLEQYEFIDEQLTNLVESIREDGDFYVYNSHAVVSEILDWHEREVQQREARAEKGHLDSLEIMQNYYEVLSDVDWRALSDRYHKLLSRLSEGSEQ